MPSHMGPLGAPVLAACVEGAGKILGQGQAYPCLLGKPQIFPKPEDFKVKRTISLSTACSDGRWSQQGEDTANEVGSDSSPSYRRSLSPMKVPLPYSQDFGEHPRLPSRPALLAPPGLPHLDVPSWSAEGWAAAQAGAVWFRCLSTTPTASDVVHGLSAHAAGDLSVAGPLCQKPWQQPEVEGPARTRRPIQQHWQQQEHAQTVRQGSRQKGFTCKFVFTGYDSARHADFELVPRLIGRGGCNMRPISEACNGKLRVRGRGSGHREHQRGTSERMESDEPLHIALSCRDGESLEVGMKELEALLDQTQQHFVRYCNKKGISPTPELFTIVA